MSSHDDELIPPGTLVRTHGSGLIGTVMPYNMTFCQDKTFPVFLHLNGVTRQMAHDELDILPARLAAAPAESGYRNPARTQTAS